MNLYPASFPYENEIERSPESDLDVNNELSLNNEPNSYGLPETPIFNYSGDVWTRFPNEDDSEPEYGPFLGKQQILIDHSLITSPLPSSIHVFNFQC